jgi:hypothetical protein
MKLEVIPQSTVLKLIKVRYPDNYHYDQVRNWCVDNCRGTWYTGHDWDNWEFSNKNRCVEFVEERDAVLFALRWS